MVSIAVMVFHNVHQIISGRHMYAEHGRHNCETEFSNPPASTYSLASAIAKGAYSEDVIHTLFY